MFTQEDLNFIKERGSNLAEVTQQIEHFKDGFPFLEVKKAATVGDGVIRLEGEEADRYIKVFEQEVLEKQIVKFVPASGAASRMFKDLFAFLDEYDGSDAAYATLMADTKNPLNGFFARLKDFAFYPDLAKAMGGEDKLNAALDAKDLGGVVASLLNDSGLGYGQMPKGLLKFHRYDAGARTPAAEHLVEAAHYAKGKGDKAYLHFTVSPEHKVRFAEEIKSLIPGFESAYGVTYEVSFSEQKAATDTIAVEMDNTPFRLDSGEPLFRPAGHGALLENLNDIDADVVFIKNIDNVVPDKLKPETYRYKKALAGLLLTYQHRIFNLLEALSGDPYPSLIEEAEAFLQEELCVSPPDNYGNMDIQGKHAYLKSKLNRPMRACGMVLNLGEPGGGPFWAANPDGTVSLQIAEGAQIDMGNPEQVSILQNATHFNPVDLICAPKDFKGKMFDLLSFRDPQTGFISEKSKDGRDLKAQELPGLWNGAMSDWITLFVEVPVVTFNPVKTVNDLLREQHQG